MLTWESPISVMRGVGSARERALASLGIHSVRDLLYHIPRGYQCRGNVRSVAEAADMARRGEDLPVSLLLTVAAEPKYRLIRRGMSVLKFRAFDETGTVEITYFNQNYLRDVFHTGGEFRFFGRIGVEGRTVKMSSGHRARVFPECRLVPEDSFRADPGRIARGGQSSAGGVAAGCGAPTVPLHIGLRYQEYPFP